MATFFVVLVLVLAAASAYQPPRANCGRRLRSATPRAGVPADTEAELLRLCAMTDRAQRTSARTAARLELVRMHAHAALLLLLGSLRCYRCCSPPARLRFSPL